HQESTYATHVPGSDHWTNIFSIRGLREMNNQMRTVAKVWGAACFAICAGLGQSETSSLSESLAAVSIPTTAARPLHWLNQHESDGATSHIKQRGLHAESMCQT